MTNLKNKDGMWDYNIPFSSFQVIKNDGENLGVMKKAKAIELANELGFNLLCVGPNSKPPICKMLEYNHYNFVQQKKMREQKRNQKMNAIKEIQIRLTVNIGENDLKRKALKAEEELKKGNRIMLSLKYKGREINNKEKGLDTINKFCELVSEHSFIDKKAEKRIGSFHNILLLPKKTNKKESS